MHSKRSKYYSKEIESAFQDLGISFTLDSSKIQSAWKKKAVLCHPDKAKSEEEKKIFHDRFISLLKARDLCNSILSQGDFSQDEDANSEDFDETILNSKEREWETFVRNERTYFSSDKYRSDLLESFLKISFHSIVVSMLITFTCIEVLFILLGIFSMAPPVPTFIWFFLPASLIFLFFYLFKYLAYLDIFILKRLTKTGYPFKYYISLWILENIIFITLILLKFNGSLYIFLLGNLGFLVQFQRIKNSIQKIEEILKNQTLGQEIQ